MTDLLVLGANGQFGTDLVRMAAAKGLAVRALARPDPDVTDAAAVTKAIEQAAPSNVVNAAAFTNVDGCERDPAQAFGVNAVGALHVARAAAHAGARLVHVSTDYVFPGTRAPPTSGATTPQTAYTETDPPGPCNTYGASKLAGEHLVTAAAPGALIVRISSVFGAAGARGKGGNFVETMIGKARRGEALSVVADQWMTPTYTVDAAEAVLGLLETDAVGAVHAANGGATTWHSFATAALQGAGLPVPIRPLGTGEYPTVAPRPRNAALHTAALERILGRPRPSWRDALARYLREKGHAR